MKKNLDGNTLNVLVYQVIFWLALFLFGIGQAYDHANTVSLKEIAIYNGCHLLFQIISANIIYHYLVVSFFERKQYLVFLISLAITLYLLAVFNRVFIVYVAEPFFVHASQDGITSILTDLDYLSIHYLFPIVTSSFIFICFMHVLRYKNERQSNLQLQKEKAELELKVLKSRLNPHFLFNTLNNIYSLSVNHPDKTPNYIAGFAEIMDHVIYKGPQKMILVDEEITAILRFIELEELRYGSKLNVNKKISLNLQNQIPPLLYLSLVENAFKHGGHNADGIFDINIEIETNATASIFKIINSSTLKPINNKTGIGLNNTDEQLRLYYKNKYVLKVESDKQWFSVEIVTPAKND
ncbi:sensor histidine kinase [Mucilaginibacter sp. KACC 22063]|uniref:sensor histidine kinase n=1 Tax=Mucilaginibacter sp. KACC 22063 TaxID=3025666 RepID=UPI002366969E|nr:histidine kinase [Mucilaginibacter sp. KACC 22063]WDF57330.1 histidine kinase [Mucilaginibacter sp. KACC 22063]